MPKKITAKKAPTKKVGKALAKSLSTIKRAVYRAKNTQPKNTI